MLRPDILWSYIQATIDDLYDGLEVTEIPKNWKYKIRMTTYYTRHESCWFDVPEDGIIILGDGRNKLIWDVDMVPETVDTTFW